MHVVVTTQVFPPEAHPTAVMVDQLTRHLAEQGHSVTVVTGFPHHPGGRLLGGYRKRPILVEERGRVTVIRAWHVTSPSKSILVRAVVMLSQMVGVLVAALLKAKAPDIVINYGPPLVGPLLSLLVAMRNRAPLLTVIYDIYPDVAIETGALKNGLLATVARWAERMVYARSSRILVLSEGFRRTLTSKGVPEEKIIVVPVWLEADEVRPAERCNTWRSEWGISPKQFVVLYAGTIGIVSGAQVVVETASLLHDTPELLFLFVGDGQVKAEVEAEATRRGLLNMRFLPLQERSRLSEVQATADLSIVTLAAGRGRTSVPSKVVGYMAGGRPVVASVDLDSDTAECVQGNECGIVVPPGDARRLADAIMLLRADDLLRSEMGRKARMAFEQQFAAQAVLQRYSAEIERVTARAPQ